MPFERGNKLGKGRGVGSKNKETELRDNIIQKFQKLVDGDKFKEKFETELMNLTGKQFLDAVSTFLEYIFPKLSRSETLIELEERKKIDELIEDTRKIAEQK